MSYNHTLSLLMLLAQAHGVKHGEGRGGRGSDGLLFLLMVVAGVCGPILVVTTEDLVLLS